MLSSTELLQTIQNQLQNSDARNWQDAFCINGEKIGHNHFKPEICALYLNTFITYNPTLENITQAEYDYNTHIENYYNALTNFWFKARNAPGVYYPTIDQFRDNRYTQSLYGYNPEKTNFLYDLHILSRIPNNQWNDELLIILLSVHPELFKQTPVCLRNKSVCTAAQKSASDHRIDISNFIPKQR